MEEFGRGGEMGVNSKGGRKGKKEKEEKKGTKWPKSTSKRTGTRTRAREIEGPRKRGHGTVNGECGRGLPKHPHPAAHPPLKKELILIRFFI